MKPEDIRELADQDLRARLAELEEERFRLKFRSATEALEDPLRLRTIRKDIARLKTIMRQRELGARAASAAPAATTASTRATGGRGATRGAGRGAGRVTTRRGTTR